jgi:recombination protein U
MPWASRGLRGGAFEEMVNMTNERYLKQGLAVVQKIPTPITPVSMDGASKTITLAYFERKSTVDYIGTAQGVPICFDAKETSRAILPIQNIHEHQIEFMDKFSDQKGLSFLIVNFKNFGECFCLPFEILKRYWNDAKRGARKSIPLAAFDKTLLIRNAGGFPVHYLEAVSELLRREFN